MPELPDIAAYIEALEPRIMGQPLERVRLRARFCCAPSTRRSPQREGRTVRELRRIGKRIAIGVDGDLWLVLHLMIAGRLHWRPPECEAGGPATLAAFDFPYGSLTLTEAGTKRRASLHIMRGEEGLRSLDAGGIDVFASDAAPFEPHGGREPHAEACPYRSAIAQRHRQCVFGRDPSCGPLSPIAQTQKLSRKSGSGCSRRRASTLQQWIERLRGEARDGFRRR